MDTIEVVGIVMLHFCFVFVIYVMHDKIVSNPKES